MTAHSKQTHHHQQTTGHCHDGACCAQQQAAASPLATPLTSQQRLTWFIDGMDCPSCAKKIENAVLQLDVVQQAQVLFTTEKLVVDIAAPLDATELPALVKTIERAVKQVGFSLRTDQQATAAKVSIGWREYGFFVLLVAATLTSYFLNHINPVWGQWAFAITAVVGVIPIAKSAWQAIVAATPFAIETLMFIAVLGALLIGAQQEACMVILLFILGEKLEQFAAHRARSGISALVNLLPKSAKRLEQQRIVSVPADQLQVDDIIEVSHGERLAADGKLLAEFASFDCSALTGEAIPVDKQQGELIAAGSLCVGQTVRVQVTSNRGENTIDRILTLVEQAEERRAPIARFIDRFSYYYTPAILLVALLVMVLPPLFFGQLWHEWLYRGLALLLIGCPCALVISTPAAITSALAAATRQGMLLKGGVVLEQLVAINTIAFDKTGTLTEGKPQLTDVVTLAGQDQQALLALAAAVENQASHPIAQAIIQQAEQQQLRLPTITQHQVIAGVGVQATLASGEQVAITSPTQLLDASLLTADYQQQIEQLESAGKTVVVVQQAQQIVGLLAVRDNLRPEAKSTLAQLAQQGIASVMLTGDSPRVAQAVAKELAIDYRAGLLPADKVEQIARLKQQGTVMMVGDGINDAPAMKSATLGMAMGSGTDVALETADAALMNNRLNALPALFNLAKATYHNIRQNITIALGLKAIFLVTTLLGMTGLWMAVLADSGATALVTLNALRLLRQPR